MKISKYLKSLQHSYEAMSEYLLGNIFVRAWRCIFYLKKALWFLFLINYLNFRGNMTLKLANFPACFCTDPNDGTSYGNCTSEKVKKNSWAWLRLPAYAYKYSRLVTSIIIQFLKTFEKYTISLLQLLIEVSKRVQDD